MNDINKMEDEIIQILEKNSTKGLTITELVENSKLSRSAVRTALARLEGANKVSVRKVGMAKVYSLNPEQQTKLHYIKKEVNKKWEKENVFGKN